MMKKLFYVRSAKITLFEAYPDDLYKAWVDAVEISRKAIGGLNSLRKLVGRLRKALYIAHALRSKHLRWYLSSILELSTSGVISTPTWFGRGSEQIEACKKYYNATYYSADLNAAKNNTSRWFRYLGTMDFDSLLVSCLADALMKLKADANGGTECTE